MNAFSAIAKRWPDIPAREILAIIAKAEARPLFVRVSTARQGAARWPYWGAVRYRLEIGAQGLPVLRALHAADRDRRSKRAAERDADATGLPWIPCRPGVVSPEFWAKL